MSGILAVPLNLLLAMPDSMVQTLKVRHEGHGLSKPPPLRWWAFVFVISSSGLFPGKVGAAILAA